MYTRHGLGWMAPIPNGDQPQRLPDVVVTAPEPTYIPKVRITEGPLIPVVGGITPAPMWTPQLASAGIPWYALVGAVILAWLLASGKRKGRGEW